MVIVDRSAPFVVMVSQISGISRAHPMASNLSICPLHSLLRLQEKNNRPDAIWTCKHTNPIIFQPSARRLNQFPQGYHGFAALSKGNFALSSRTAPHVRDPWASHPSISLIFTGRPSFMDLVAAAAMRIGARPSSLVTCVSVPLMTASAKALCSAAKAMV